VLIEAVRGVVLDVLLSGNEKVSDGQISSIINSLADLLGYLYILISISCKVIPN